MIQTHIIPLSSGEYSANSLSHPLHLPCSILLPLSPQFYAPSLVHSLFTYFFHSSSLLSSTPHWLLSSCLSPSFSISLYPLLIPCTLPPRVIQMMAACGRLWLCGCWCTWLFPRVSDFHSGCAWTSVCFCKYIRHPCFSASLAASSLSFVDTFSQLKHWKNVWGFAAKQKEKYDEQATD